MAFQVTDVLERLSLTFRSFISAVNIFCQYYLLKNYLRNNTQLVSNAENG